ncbi:DNA mismatch repair endonuclease MutL [Veillonella sp. oral taxon 780]|uniref:DNA mismatch repair endonuclease MutL n=1 Tax=Veillonella sp. oral taxon 780 TaxID=671229 RepID=UPI00021A2101|nr:DNA mismatch repair endonuclease MutL [Veillonella sp. oral taxon 780]EGS40241.1 DNA mismatch repair protein [Veillonella sp. oral taxon 780 str. F0422]
MPTIHVLDETTINQIAAGEVVERPASVIKELVENAIDAGATSIEVEIAEGGIEYMRITDNGCGMSEVDARLAVLRHATSKIRSADDLYDIASLGFRGEAIASIASVSKFTLRTRQETDTMGTRIYIEGGHMVDCDPCGTSVGTSIEVKDLFYNTPARRKFLKSTRTEANKIQDMIGKLALSHTHIAFKCIVDTRVTIMTPGNHKMVDTIAALYGFKVSEDVFPIAYEAEGIYVEGVVSKPTVLKSSRQWQTTIVNQRVISDKAIYKAIDTAYHALLPKGGYPLVVLQIVVPPGTVDINVHPRKSEVKFSDDKPVFKAVYNSILQALEHPTHHRTSQQEETIATAIDYDKVFTGRSQGFTVMREKTEALVDTIRQKGYTAPQRTVYEQGNFNKTLDVNENFVPKSYTQEDKDRFRAIRESRPNLVPSSVEPYINHAGNESVSIYLSTVQGLAGDSRTGDALGIDSSYDTDHGNSYNTNASKTVANHGLLPMGQVASCYILAKKGDDLYIIDQHAAHERVRYDKLCKSSESIPMQELLMPMYMDVSEEELTLAEEQRDALLDLGFQVDQGGPTSLRIDGHPVDIIESKVPEILQYVFSYMHDHQSPSAAQLRHEMLAYASCRGAIKAGHNLNLVQIDALLQDLFSTEKPYVCPHGRPTIIKFTPDELGKLFLRS